MLSSYKDGKKSSGWTYYHVLLPKIGEEEGGKLEFF